ncbi:MAG: (4Fe-4S)-binding protein [Bacteroidota bacterium]|nr:(4Fe-4S)-binding protein [Bacteroidota bacterium]
MPKETLKYTNDEVTVVWKPKVCIHSTICWKGLIEVFNPKERPWVKIDGATTEKIIEQVRQCPSGALSYYLNAEAITDEPSDKVVAESTQMMKADSYRVEVTPNGPYLIKTQCLIVHSDGREETKTGTVALCRCGASGNKPYCDGSHGNVGFEG